MSVKKENFKRLAEKRVQRTINDLRLIGNLSNRGNYDYDDSQIAQIFDVLDGELKKARLRFRLQDSSSEKVFKLR